METLIMPNLPEATHWYCGEGSGGCGSYGLVSQLKKLRRANCPYCDHTKLTMMGGANQVEDKENKKMNDKPVIEAEVVSTSIETVIEKTEGIKAEEVKPVEAAPVVNTSVPVINTTETEPTPVVTKKPRKESKPVAQIVFPDGEFTAKSLVALSGQPQPVVCKQINEAEAKGLIKHLRDDKVAGQRGRPTRVFSKV